jgi:TolB-like protein
MDIAALQVALGTAYRIQRELGRGGMATVYLADDTKHGRQVALKVLHPEFAASLGPDRFRREITTAARLQHPHILTVYDSGETADGLLWFTMPYVVGESLRDRLRRERQLSVEDMARITSSIADALRYAHEHGVIHRDIKPENILLSDGHALLADFGVASTNESTTTTLTQTGYTVGTPSYMSPEQASGERQIDGRSDEYALAVVAYEMLAGEPPFTAPTPQAVIAKMLVGPPPSIRVVRHDVPIGIDAALQKALQSVPAARYGDVKAFGAAIASGVHTGTVAVQPRAAWRRFAAVAAVLVLVAGAFAYMHFKRPAGPTMLAVLPFETDGDTADAWITDGITDEVRGRLAAVSGVRVIARSSSNQYRRTTKRPEDIGRELGVRYLLMGRIRWARGGGDRHIRVEPELVQVADVRTPETTWGEPFDEQQSDVYKLQTDIAERVADALRVALDPAERRAIRTPETQNPEAYLAYLRGTALAHTNVPDDMMRARGYFRQAVAMDSTFVEAWDWLADNMTNWAGRHTYDRAFEDSVLMIANRLATLAPASARGPWTLALYQELMRHDAAKAYALYATALARTPNDPNLLSDIARVEMRLGKWDSVIVHSERTVVMNPRNAYLFAALGNAYLLVHRFDDAGRACRHSQLLQPTNILGAFCAIQVPLARGNLAATRAAVRAVSPAIDSITMYVFLASYGGYTWALDSAQRRTLLGVSENGFERGRSAYAFVRMLIHDQFGDSAAAVAYADTAAQALIKDNGQDAADSDSDYGWALAIAGHKPEAIAAADRYIAGHPIDGDYLDGPDNAEGVVKAYARAGQTDKALDLLERLIHMPGRQTPGRAKLDPAFAPLRNTPRFQRLSP